jgi:hypothetical protein
MNSTRTILASIAAGTVAAASIAVVTTAPAPDGVKPGGGSAVRLTPARYAPR